MQVKKRVLAVVGNAIKKHGFEFCPNLSNANLWTFQRAVDARTHEITIARERYDSSLQLYFKTTPSYSFLGADAKRIIPPKKYRFDDDFGILGAGYKDEQELEIVLEEFVEIIEKYGLDELDKMSADDDTPTEEESRELAATQIALSEKFIRRYNISLSNGSGGNIGSWFDIIFGKLKEYQDAEYEDIQDDLIEMAAFLGEQLRKVRGGVWHPVGRFTGCELRNMKGNMLLFLPLFFLTNTWKDLYGFQGEQMNMAKGFYLALYRLRDLDT